MRSYQVFAAMSPARGAALLRRIADEAPAVFAQALGAACAALRARPVYLQRQPFEKRAEAVRRALARVTSNAIAEEILAVYFLECRKDLLVEWLDAVGLEHEDGTLTGDSPPAPATEILADAVEKFRARDADPDRGLLLHAFAAQDAIDWPALDERLGALA
jgi:hypothetical protein